MPSSPATLEIFTDCTCPWCYFMSGRIAQLKKEYHIQIRRRMFPFCADTPKEGLPAENVQKVLKAGTFKELVGRDWAMAEEMNILVLPTFVVNGDRLVGAQPYHKLQRLMVKSGVVTKRE